MKNHLLRWALLCVAATPGLLLASPTSASQTVVIGPGDSIDSLARRFHVSNADIARANGIDKDAILRDGRRLTIPDPPRSVSKPGTMRRSALVKGDRITIRLGPDESYRRLTMLDHGVELLATRRAGDWFQVELPSGRTGWIRGDFLAVGGGSARTASRVADAKPAKRYSVRRVARKNDDNDGAKPAVRKRVARSARMSKREQRAELSRKHRLALAKARRHRNDEDDAPRSRRSRQAAASHTRGKKSRRESVRYVSSRYPRYPRSHGPRHGRPEASAPDTDADVVRTAYAYRGVPYHYGGSSRGGFDCSGFTSYVYRKKGVNLPHSAADQYNHGKRVSSGNLKAGDLVFFHTTRRGVSHVGIYAGEGKFVHASSGGGRVRVDSLNSGYYKKRLVGARRMKDD